jgi:hypothetical protein
MKRNLFSRFEGTWGIYLGLCRRLEKVGRIQCDCGDLSWVYEGHFGGLEILWLEALRVVVEVHFDGKMERGFSTFHHQQTILAQLV